MYAPAYTRVEDEADALAMIAAHAFATFVVAPEGKPILAYAPFVRDPENERVLIGHVARANPIWQAIGAGCDAVASFLGPDAYVSPSYYASKREHGRVVPTWNYVAVEVHGRAVVETSASEMRPFLEAMTQLMEAPRAEPWHVSDAPADYIDQRCHAIVGVRLEMSSVMAKRKLSQNVSQADFDGVVQGLSQSDQPGARQIAEQMRAEAQKIKGV